MSNPSHQPPARLFRCFFHQSGSSLGSTQQSPYNPKGIIRNKDFHDSIFDPYWGLSRNRYSSDAWPFFYGALITYSPTELRDDQFELDWDAVSARLSESPRNQALPDPEENKTFGPFSAFYNRWIRKVVLAWIDEVDLQLRLRSDEVTQLENDLSNLYTESSESETFVGRAITDIDLEKLGKVFRLVHPARASELHEHFSASPPKAGEYGWVKAIANSHTLRDMARDLPQHAAQCLLLAAQNALAQLNDYQEEPMLVKLLQDVAHYTNSFPKYAQVPPTHFTANLAAPVAHRGTEGLIRTAALRGEPVLIKTLKTPDDISKRGKWKAQKRHTRESLLWLQLSLRRVPNIVELKGVLYEPTKEFGQQLCPIMPQHTPARQYLRGLDEHSQRYVFPAMALGIASGLEQLHRRNIAHGDLHWSNVLIKPSKRIGGRELIEEEVLLCDFGMMRIQHRGDNSTTIEPRNSYYAAFTAPELQIKPEEGEEIRPNSPVDIYSLAKTLYALFMISDPPKQLGEDWPAALPDRIGISRSLKLWRLMQAMTATDPSQRPTIFEVEPKMRALLENF